MAGLVFGFCFFVFVFFFLQDLATTVGYGVDTRPIMQIYLYLAECISVSRRGGDEWLRLSGTDRLDERKEIDVEEIKSDAKWTESLLHITVMDVSEERRFCQ